LPRGRKRFIKNPEKFEGLQTRVVLRIDSVLERPLLRKDLLNDPILTKLRVILQPRGRNYEVTPKQVTRIEQMLNHTPQATLTRVLARVNSSFHFSFVAKRLLLTSGETAFSQSFTSCRTRLSLLRRPLPRGEEKRTPFVFGLPRSLAASWQLSAAFPNGFWEAIEGSLSGPTAEILHKLPPNVRSRVNLDLLFPR